MDKLSEITIKGVTKKGFPKANILSYKQFDKGMVNIVVKVKINNPKKDLVIKLSKLKNKNRVHQANKILDYLRKNNLPVPKIYFEDTYNRKFITIMDCIPGKIASEIYKRSNSNIKKKILKNSGKILRKIHNLRIPNFWVHQHHEIKNQEEWKKWTKLRINKYLEFFKRKLPEQYNYLENELNSFLKILENEKHIEFVPLHWDYNLYNLNSNTSGKIMGVFDFDSAMKGHNLADIGQFEYFMMAFMKDHKNFKYFLKGYKKNLPKKELKLIKGYFLLHLLAITRTIWFRQKRLSFVVENHKKILDEFMGNEPFEDLENRRFSGPKKSQDFLRVPKPEHSK